jgi:hypothetical protein
MQGSKAEQRSKHGAANASQVATQMQRRAQTISLHINDGSHVLCRHSDDQGHCKGNTFRFACSPQHQRLHKLSLAIGMPSAFA